MNHSPISSKGPQKYAPHSPCFSLIQIGQEMCCNMCYKGDSLVSVVILFLRFRLIMTNDMSVTSRTSNPSEVRWYCMCVAYVYYKNNSACWTTFLHLLGWYASSTKGGGNFAHQNSDKKKPKNQTKCQETITTGAHQGFEGSNAATTGHFAVLGSPTVTTRRVAPTLRGLTRFKPTGEEINCKRVEPWDKAVATS